jgi:hypothetical protein
MPPGIVVQSVPTSAGTLEIVDIVQFATLLYNRHEREILEVIGTNAIEDTVFGLKPNKKKRKKDPVKSVEVLTTNNDPWGQDSVYKRVAFPLKEIGPEENMIDAIMVQIIALVVPYQMYAKPKDEQEAFEIVAVEAMENFICPTHIVKIKPKLAIAVDADDFKLKIMDDSGIIRMAVYTEKAAALKALEIP